MNTISIVLFLLDVLINISINIIIIIIIITKQRELSVSYPLAAKLSSTNFHNFG